jgi:hypothetical protein
VIVKSLGSSTVTQAVVLPLTGRDSENVTGAQAAASAFTDLDSPDEPETARDRLLKRALVSASIGTVVLSGYLIGRLF